MFSNVKEFSCHVVLSATAMFPTLMDNRDLAARVQMIVKLLAFYTKYSKNYLTFPIPFLSHLITSSLFSIWYRWKVIEVRPEVKELDIQCS